MAIQEFKNKGPIYIRQEKYEELRVAGTLETGREYKIIDWEGQENLISGENIKTINNTSILGSGDIETASEEDIKYTNTNGTTITVGGIQKGTTFDNQPLKTIIENMLYPYVQFTFNSISTTPIATTYEYGDSKIITAVTPYFTSGSKNINSVKIGSTSGGEDLYTGTTITSGTSISLTAQKELDGLSNTTIYCTLSDGTTTTEKTATFNFEKYNYYAVTNSTSAPTSGGTAIGTNTDVNITISEDDSYIWYLCTTAKTKIQQFALNQWNDITTVSEGTITFTTSKGQALTYYAYRTDKMVTSTGRYQIV